MSIGKRIFGVGGTLDKILQSSAFIGIIAVIVMFFWTIDKMELGVSLLLYLLGFTLCFCYSATSAMAIIGCGFFIFTGFDSIKNSIPILVGFVFVFASAIVNLIRFRPQFSLKGFSFTVILCLFAWLFGGITVQNREPSRVLACIGVAVLMAVIYFFFLVTTRASYEVLLRKLVVMLFFIGIILTYQILTFYSRIGNLEAIKEYLCNDAREGLILGWGGRNNVGTLLSLVLPTTFYLATKSNRFSFLFIILGVIEFIAILLTNSRGTMLAILLFMPLIILYSIVCAKHKFSVIGIYIVLGALLAIVILKNKEVALNIFSRFKTSGLDLSGRENLYADGWTQFFNHPIFGVGFDHKSELYYSYITHSKGPTYFHSTFVQIFASFGIFGAILYFYSYYWRYVSLATDITPLKIALILGMLVFETYNLIDTNFFQPQGYFIILMMTMVCEKGLSTNQAGVFLKLQHKLRII